MKQVLFALFVLLILASCTPVDDDPDCTAVCDPNKPGCESMCDY